MKMPKIKRKMKRKVRTLTNSIAFPNMFDVVRNRVAVLEGNASIVNRTRLLMLTEPTELYNAPTFGVGLKKYLFQYNNDNVKAMIQDRIKDQLRLFEPCCDAEGTEFTDGLILSGHTDTTHDFNKLEKSVGLKTVFGDVATVNMSDLQALIDQSNGDGING